MTKAELRRAYKAKRNALANQEYIQRNQQIFQLFRDIFPTEETATVHCYLASEKKREVSTSLIINYLLTQSNIRIATSRSYTGGRLTHHLFTSNTKLETNQWGISEPLATEPTVGVEEINWVVVPLLAFDYRGYRVGYGKGFYDRFLAECRPDVVKVGLSLEPPVDHITDTNSHDIPLDQVITPDKVFSY